MTAMTVVIRVSPIRIEQSDQIVMAFIKKDPSYNSYNVAAIPEDNALKCCQSAK